MNSRVAAVAGLALACTVPSLASGECTLEPRATIVEEQNRIGDCLADAARFPRAGDDGDPGERRIYTWGPAVKIERMLGDPHFCDYEFARQREYELRKFADFWSPATDEWYGYPVAPGLNELNAVDIDRRHKNRLSLLYVFQGFLPRGVTLEQRVANIQADVVRYEELPASPAKSQAAGRAAAHAQPFSNRPSSIKTGRGVYFGLDPFNYFDQAGGNTQALVCDLPNTRSIVDLTDPDTRALLSARKITYSETNDLYGASIVPFINNPRLFDAAARGRFIVRANIPQIESPREQVFVDKCLIHYGACRALSVEAQNLSCEDFGRLAGVMLSGGSIVADGDAPELGLAAQRVFTDAEDFREQFVNRSQQCFGTTPNATFLDAMRTAGRGPLADALQAG